jgi:MYXO-CTERM domain-containing protein
MRAALPAGLLAGLVLASAQSHAYVRSVTERNAAVRWPSHCVNVVAHIPDPPPNLTPELVLGATQAAAAVWSRPAVTCTDLELQVAVSEKAAANAANDQRNNVVFRRGEWCRLPRDPAEPCYDPAALAITTVYAKQGDGGILDADVELNGVNFNWGDLVANVGADGGNVQDLQNTLTHEFGHLIGLDHNCFLPIPGARRAVDNTGAQVPDCARASPEVQEATMFAAVQRGDVARRTLAADDLAGVCAIYPASGAAACPPPGNGEDEDGGCSVSRSGGGTSGALPLVVALGVVLALRRRRRA